MSEPKDDLVLFKFCKCGCGQVTRPRQNGKGYNNYIKGHGKRSADFHTRGRGDAPLCLCGCQMSVLKHREGYWNKYLAGHVARGIDYHTRGTGIPPLCQCGCLQPVQDIRRQQLHNNPEFLRKTSERTKKQWNDPEFQQINLDRIKKVWADPDYRSRASQRMRDRWNDPEERIKMIERPLNKPNKLESLFDSLTNDRIVFIGNGQFWRTWPSGKHKNPDYLVHDKYGKSTKCIIELFGTYWHRHDDPMVDIEMWHRIGYECLVIWEHELKEDQETVLDLVSNFIGEEARKESNVTHN